MKRVNSQLSGFDPWQMRVERHRLAQNYTAKDLTLFGQVAQNHATRKWKAIKW